MGFGDPMDSGDPRRAHGRLRPHGLRRSHEPWRWHGLRRSCRWWRPHGLRRSYGSAAPGGLRRIHGWWRFTRCGEPVASGGFMGCGSLMGYGHSMGYRNTVGSASAPYPASPPPARRSPIDGPPRHMPPWWGHGLRRRSSTSGHPAPPWGFCQGAGRRCGPTPGSQVLQGAVGRHLVGPRGLRDGAGRRRRGLGVHLVRADARRRSGRGRSVGFGACDHQAYHVSRSAPPQKRRPRGAPAAPSGAHWPTPTASHGRRRPRRTPRRPSGPSSASSGPGSLFTFLRRRCMWKKRPSTAWRCLGVARAARRAASSRRSVASDRS